MPKPTVVLKSTVTRRPAAEPVDQAERQLQAEHHQAAEADTAAGASPSTETAPPEPEKSLKQPKRDLHALQAAFLTGNLNRPLIIYMVNGLRLTGRLREFDQYCLLLEGPAPMLVFKHAISTIAPVR